MDNGEKNIQIEEAKRKELSRTRIFWFLIIANIALLAYFVYQIICLVK